MCLQKLFAGCDCKWLLFIIIVLLLCDRDDGCQSHCC